MSKRKILLWSIVLLAFCLLACTELVDDGSGNPLDMNRDKIDQPSAERQEDEFQKERENLR